MNAKCRTAWAFIAKWNQMPDFYQWLRTSMLHSWQNVSHWCAAAQYFLPFSCVQNCCSNWFTLVLIHFIIGFNNCRSCWAAMILCVTNIHAKICKLLTFRAQTCDINTRRCTNERALTIYVNISFARLHVHHFFQNIRTAHKLVNIATISVRVAHGSDSIYHVFSHECGSHLRKRTFRNFRQLFSVV